MAGCRVSPAELACALDACAAERASRGWIAEQGDESVRNGANRLGIDEARRAGVEILRERFAVRGDDGGSGCETLERRESPAFVERWVEEDVGTLLKRGERGFVHGTHDPDALLQRDG